MGDMNYRLAESPDTGHVVTVLTLEEKRDSIREIEVDGDSDTDDDWEHRNSHVLNLIKEEKWAKLLAFDELDRELAAGRVLPGFRAVTPSFPPTFKRTRYMMIEKLVSSSFEYTMHRSCKSGKEVLPPAEVRPSVASFYDKKRIPSYTDRVLYRSLPGFVDNIQPVSFVSCEATTSSDHKPVVCSFDLTTTGGLSNIIKSSSSNRAFDLELFDMKAYNLAEMDTDLLGHKAGKTN